MKPYLLLLLGTSFACNQNASIKLGEEDINEDTDINDTGDTDTDDTDTDDTDTDDTDTDTDDTDTDDTDTDDTDTDDTDTEDPSDRDDDGYTVEDGDCDDSDENTFPGAAENDSETDCLTDADGDGYGDINAANPGTDCDDSNENAFPGATEVAEDTIDQDCDGADLFNDDDTDGFTEADGDCDDSDENTFPGSAENDSETDCLTDADGDGYGDLNGTNPGTDCDDADGNTFPGSAENDSETDCLTDADGDGYGDIDAANPGTDCLDNDDTSYPGAPDISVDGTDQNCDGTDGPTVTDSDGDGVDDVDDCEPSDPTIGAEQDWYLDVDQDGYGSTIIPPTSSCTAPLDGNGNPYSNNSDDCNDADNAIYPGATETYYDGNDDNCDTSDEYDADGDGYDSIDYGGTDCDDNDPLNVPSDADSDGYTGCDGDCDDSDASINPDAGESLWDGIDNNCDEIVDNISSEDYDNAVTGNSTDYLSFDNAISVGDANGDGANDLVIGGGLMSSSSAAYVGGMYMLDGSDYDTWDGPATDYSDASFDGDDAMNYFGLVAETQTDMSGDGLVDLAIGGTDGAGEYSGYANIAAAIYLDAGSLSGNYAPTDADITFTSADLIDQEGNAPNYGSADITTNLDLNGDGITEFLYSVNLGGYYYDGDWYNTSCGYAAPYRGCDSMLFFFDGADVVDGYVSNGGGTYALDLYSDATKILEETTNYDYFGQSIDGADLNGDGADELIVSSPGNDEEESGGGCVFIYNGSEELVSDSGYIWESDDFDFYFEYDNARICSETEDARLGWNSGVSLGDFNGDGVTDLAVAGPGADPGDLAQVFVFFDVSSLMGQPHIAEQDADVIITGTDTFFGYGLSSGDYNGDGIDDLAIGSPRITDPIDALFGYNALLENGSPTGNGSVFLFSGATLSSGTDTDGDGIIDFADTNADGKIESPNADLFGITIVSSDMNGDGKEDIWVGAPMHDGDAGRASLYIMP